MVLHLQAAAAVVVAVAVLLQAAALVVVLVAAVLVVAVLVVMDTDPNEDYITIDITKDGLALMYRSVCFHLDKWPGGDSYEQQGLMLMKDNLFRLMLEFEFRKP